MKKKLPEASKTKIGGIWHTRIVFYIPVVMTGEKSFWFKVGKVQVNIPKSITKVELEERRKYILWIPDWWIEKNKTKLDHLRVHYDKGEKSIED